MFVLFIIYLFRCLQENQYVNQIVPPTKSKTATEGQYKSIAFNGVKKF